MKMTKMIYHAAVAALTSAGLSLNTASAEDAALHQVSPEDKLVSNWLHRYCDVGDSELPALAQIADRAKYKGLLSQLEASGPSKVELDAVRNKASYEYDIAIAPAFKNPSSITMNPDMLAKIKAPTRDAYINEQVRKYGLAYKERSKLALMVLEKAPAGGIKDR